MHPSLRIMLLLLLAVAVQLVELRLLAMTAAALVALAMYWHVGLLHKILYRSRWLLLTLLLVYAFTTPGEYLRNWDVYAPTYEGISQGVLQAARLATMLAGLALLLGTTPRPELMAGIYQLIRPLHLLGISIDRFTARLWLTMHYVETARPPHEVPFWQRFDVAAGWHDTAAIDTVAFDLPRFSRKDGVVVLVLIAMAAWWLA